MSDTTEQLMLIGFAARLGTCVSHDDCESDDGDLRSEAQLLMNLLVSNTTSESAFIGNSWDLANSVIDNDLNRKKGAANVETTKNPNAFQFSCPSLSLDAKAPLTPGGTTAPQLRERLPSDDTESSIPSLVDPPAPMVAMGRPLVVEDRDALRLSAEAMGRNILKTFEKALMWRKQCWVDALCRPLVDEEAALKEGGASEEELRALLETPEAKVISSLHQATIDVLDARTSFRVLPQRWNKDGGSSELPPLKKRKSVNDGVETSEEYCAAYVLSFQTVLNLSSPAGYSQVTLEAPGFMEGKFISSPSGDVTLTGVAVEIDTRVLASMIEKSSRIIARASTEAIINCSANSDHLEAEVASPYPTSEDQAMSNPDTTTAAPPCKSTSGDAELPNGPTIVTPHSRSTPHSYCDNDLEYVKKACPPIPEDLCAQSQQRSFLRMVSPPPGSSSSDESVELNTHGLTMKRHGFSLVSPPPSRYSADGATMEYLSFDSKTGPSLPALLEAASAAMVQANLRQH